jgi:methionyl-tRNA formyltransferase
MCCATCPNCWQKPKVFQSSTGAPACHEAVEHVRAWTPDLTIVAAFGQILSTTVLYYPQFGTLTSTVPLRAARGNTLQAALQAGDEITCVPYADGCRH